ncbi:MAG: putative bifunctional diguanylate cyclase/phosphodiesterase [Chloroflexota bacterium]
MSEREIGQSILLVDDEANIRSSLRRLFRPDNYRVLTAASGDEGLTVLASQACPLVIADNQMPGMTGIEFLRRVREQWPDTIRVMLTGYADLEAAMAAINRGEVYRFVTKPWEPAELRALVRDGLAQYRLVQSKRNEQQRQTEHLAYLTTHDPLTGLTNRSTLEVALQQALFRNTGGGARSVALLLEVDNFKLVNDSLGHTAGDQLLVTLTRLLRENLRGGDLLARIGGDEFGVLLERSSREEAELVAEQLRRTVDEFRFRLDGADLQLSLSIGLVALAGQADAVAVLSQAHVALESAKAQGRNRVVVYRIGEDRLTWFHDANQWAVRLKDALREGHALLHYQPIVNLVSGQVELFEALVRLRDERGRLVYPNSFIPAAEHFGLIPQLTRWVLGATAVLLQARPEARVFVNLSSQCLGDEDLLGFIEQLLAQGGIEPARLGLEITETAVVQDLALAERWVRRLKALGCRFAVDDFGAGFSSFSYLRSLSADVLKIDGSLIRTLAVDSTQRALVQAIQALAQTLGKETVAECVENESTARILQDLGVTYGQGYYFGRPGPSLNEPRSARLGLALSGNAVGQPTMETATRDGWPGLAAGGNSSR